MHFFVVLLVFVLLHLTNAEIITKRGCPSNCGDVTVPCPFGIEGHNCSIDPSFDIICNHSTNPPKAFLPGNNSDVEVYSISINSTELRVPNFNLSKCPPSGNQVDSPIIWNFNLEGTPYMYSNSNVVTVVGCNYSALISPIRDPSVTGCITTCEATDQVRKDECSVGSGCCQVPFSDQQKNFQFQLGAYNNSTGCAHAFFSKKERFKFRGKSDLDDFTFQKRNLASAPVILDWVMGNTNCKEAAGNQSSYACKDENSDCFNATGSSGYLCR